MGNNNLIELAHGGGGHKSGELISEIREILDWTGDWQNCGDDAAVFDLTTNLEVELPSDENKRKTTKTSLGNGVSKLVFTTDAFIIDPIFFPGGDIGEIAICGTINDLSVMGAQPLGVSLSLIIEEGFPKEDLIKIMKSVAKISKEAGVPIVTGDTKVMERGKIDKIEITTAGVGLADKVIHNNGTQHGDHIITSGDLGEHGIALLSYRFNYKTKIKSDSKPLNKELAEVGQYLNACKDPTRGGLAANLNEMAEKANVRIILDNKTLPYKKEAVALSELLGIDIFSLPSEGRFISSVTPKNSDKVLKILRIFNKEAKIIGKAESLGNSVSKLDKSENKKTAGVFLKTQLGSLRKIEVPKGKLIPRIC